VTVLGVDSGGYREKVIKPPFTRESISAILSPKNQAWHTPKPQGPEKATGPLSVLVAEDLFVNQEIASAMLRQLGGDVTIAENGRRAVELAITKRFDIIFMDCQMPEMDGYEATELIREYEQLNPAENRRYIVALTAGDSESDRSRALASGMDDFLQKPFEKAMIRKAIDSAAETSKSLNEQTATRLLDQKPTLDVEVTSRLIQLSNETGSSTLLLSLKDGFDTQFETMLKDLEYAFIECDEDAIKRISHGLKSMSANIGATELKLITERMEKYDWRQREFVGSVFTTTLRAAYQRFDTEFSDLCKQCIAS
jgi:CheY-like chemotaxis protein